MWKWIQTGFDRTQGDTLVSPIFYELVFQEQCYWCSPIRCLNRALNKAYIKCIGILLKLIRRPGTDQRTRMLVSARSPKLPLFPFVSSTSSKRVNSSSPGRRDRELWEMGATLCETICSMWRWLCVCTSKGRQTGYHCDASTAGGYPAQAIQ